MSRNKARGTSFERLIADQLAAFRFDLAGWVTEAETERGNLDAIAGVVVHKRKGKGQALDQYVTLTLRDLIALLGGDTNA